MSLITIDGAYGEGGGQVLRTATALSAFLGVPVRIQNIRANRKKPGLRPQHLTAVKALQEICRAKVEGAAIGSRELVFNPGPLRSGEYRFEVGTAGSTSLVLQALLLPLAFSEGPSRVTIIGGTHVPWSPPFHYLERVFLPAMARMGIQVALRIPNWGWYPQGGGEIRAEIEPTGCLKPLQLNQVWKPDWIQVLLASSRLPGHIRQREKEQIEERLTRQGLAADFEVVEGPSPGPGNMAFIAAGSAQGWAGFTSLGRKGKRAEEVADEGVDQLLDFLQSGAAAEEHLADQLIPYLALATGPSEIRVPRISSHLETNLWVVGRFCNPEITFQEEGPAIGVRINPIKNQGDW